MKESPIISVIVPVYNTEQYLECCLNSVLLQTFKDFEVLLIDDGSTDKSGEICDKYALKDSRIRVFHKENGGVSSARNVGLRNAKGKWLTFLDSDDELMLYALDFLINIVNDHSDIDIVLAGYDTVDLKNGIVKSTSELPYTSKIVNRDSAIKLMYRSDFYLCFICSKLYKNSIIKKNKLFFDETIYYSEDRLFIIQYLCNCRNQIQYTTKSIYKYFYRDNSAMTSLVNTFNYKSITGFYATLLMYKALKDIGTTKDNIFYALEDVINSYDYTLKRMKDFSIKDGELKRTLQRKIFGFISYNQYFLMRIRKMMSFFKNKI